jgi:hypothetical protein
MNIRQWINYLTIKTLVSWTDSPLSLYAEGLASGKPYSFARYGDGEWSAMLGKQGANCDGHQYTPELGRRLCAAVSQPADYLYGLQRCAMRNDGRAIARFVRKNKVNIPWHNSDVLHLANIDGRLYPLVNELRKMCVVMVGPEYLRKAEGRLFPFAQFIEVPQKDCFRAVERLKEEIVQAVKGREKMVIALSASMAANVIIHELYPQLGKAHWMIDFGSLWDIYAGVKSRGHYNTLDWEKLMRINLGEQA